MRLLRAVLLGCCLACSASACRQVLGIEAAEEDPSLSRGGMAGSSGSTGLQSAGGRDEPASGGAAGSAAGESGGVAVGGATEPSLGGGAGAGAAAITEAGAAGAGGAAEPPTLCEQYCTAVTATCRGAFAVYTSFATCLSVCAALPQGAPGDRNVNSVHCRLRAALVANDEVPHYCPIAGPGGNGVCGSNCEGLCQLRDGICADYSESDVAACLQSCAKLDDLGSFSTDLNLGQYGGPHVQCRLYHVSAASADDPEQHCLHVDGAAPCK